MMRRSAHVVRGRPSEEHGGPSEALVRSHAQERVDECCVVKNREGVLVVSEQPWGAEDFKASVDADKKFWRPDPTVDRALLGAFDLTWNGAKLAGRIKFGLDAAVRVLFDRRRESLHPFVLSVIQRRGA